MIQLSKHSPILRIKGNETIGNNLDIIVSYRIELDEIHTLSVDNLDSRFEAFYSAIKTLPIGSAVLKQDIIVRTKYDTTNWNKTGYINEENAKHFANRQTHEHVCFMHIIHNNKGSILRNENIKNPFIPLGEKMDYKSNEEDRRNILSSAERVMSVLSKSCNYKISKCTQNDLEELTDRYFNGLVTNKYTDTIHDEDYNIGDRLLNVYCIKSNKQFGDNEFNNVSSDPKHSTKFVQYSKPCIQDFLFSENADIIYNQFISIEDHFEIRQGIRKLKRDFEKAGTATIDFDNTAENLGKLDKELSEDSRIQFIRAHFNICLISDSTEEMQEAQSKMETAFTQIGIKPYQPKGNMLSNIYNNSFYSVATNLDIDNTFTADLQLALCLFNYETPYRSDAKGIQFTSRLGNIPFTRDVWDEQKTRIKARNFMMIAPTGEGKSNLAQHVLISQYFQDKKNVIVICDLGNSFEKLAYLFPEESVFIRYKEGESLGINPFGWYGDGEVTNDFISDIIGFLKIPYKRGASLTDEEEVSLGKILKYYYSIVPSGHSFPQFYGFVNAGRENLLDELEIPIDDEKYFDIKQFLHNCGEFVDDGKMAFLFSDNASEHYNVQGKRFIVFEFDQAKDNPTLLAMLLQLKDNIIQRLIWADRSTKGIVFYDEVAKFFNFPMVFSSICYSAQTMRKYEAAIGMALQSPTQLPLDKLNENNTKALVKNTQVFYCLPDRTGYEAHQEILRFSPKRMYLLGSLKSDFSGNPSYAELLLCLGDEEWIARAEFPETVKLIYATEGKKHEEVIGLYKELGSIEKAVNHYLKN